ncbi:MAG: VCBS repeat-containing protein, partial [Clostridia bacterium]|nr:VCBS repeat-containing protein [Clostridia bacterium]
MKKITTVVALLLIISIAFSGCSFELRSIESLMRPPYNSVESELENSIKKLLGNQISYRSPESGEYHSAITIRDINFDGYDEAIVFYVNNNDVSVVRMCVMTKSGEEWVLVSDFAGNGSDVLKVEFADLNADDDDEIMVTWFLFDDKSQKVLSVYTSGAEQSLMTVSACISEPYNLMILADVYGADSKQLLVAYHNATRSSGAATLRLIDVDEKDEVMLLNELVLDDRIISLSSMLYDYPTENALPRFYIDAEISDGQCITQVVTWNPKSHKLESVLNDSENPGLTVRSNDLLCRDVDGDGIIEIPLRKLMSESINSDTSLGYLLAWCKVNRKGLQECEYYVVNLLESYTLYFTESWKNKVFVHSDNPARIWYFVNSDNETL